MLLAVAGFGLATIGFGFSHWFWLSFLMLFVCGAMDNISVVVRHTLVQLLTPDEKRGRVSAVNSLFIGTSNELGGFESRPGGLPAGPGVLRRLRRGRNYSRGDCGGRHLARDAEVRAAGCVDGRRVTSLHDVTSALARCHL